MCVSFFAWDALPDVTLLLAFNRDESFERPTETARFWADHPHILGGRDARGGGTWLAVSRRGRVAWLTNVRENPATWPPEPPSRGALVVAALESPRSVTAHLEDVPAQTYAGFNLVVADLPSRQCAYLSNRGDGGPRLLLPGQHALANAGMDGDWPKLSRGGRRLAALLEARKAVVADGVGSEEGAARPAASPDASPPAIPWEGIFEMLSDSEVLETNPSALPNTSYPASFEAAVSGVFVSPLTVPSLGVYGTRAQTVLACGRDGRCELRERARMPSGEWEETRHVFTMEQ